MLLATWNLNSIRAREERLLAWLKSRQPDVVCLQELKCTEDQFPFEAIEAAGYQAKMYGEERRGRSPSWNGVAILSKSNPTDVSTGFGDGGDESQARVIAATIDQVRIISVYVPQGGARQDQSDTEAREYKRTWLRRLKSYLKKQDLTAPVAICGDYNIIPGRRDVAYHHMYWTGPIYNEELCKDFEELLELGLVDTLDEWREKDAVQLSDLPPGDERLVGCIKEKLPAADLKIGMLVRGLETGPDMIRSGWRIRHHPLPTYMELEPKFLGDKPYADPVWYKDLKENYPAREKKNEQEHEREFSRDVADNVILDDKMGWYSYWDYRMKALDRNNGLRIDHILATPSLAGTKGKKVTGARVDKDEREGKKPSDHAPVLTEFAD